MKPLNRFQGIALLIAGSVLLTGCGGGDTQATEPTRVETTSGTTETTASEPTTSSPSASLPAAGFFDPKAGAAEVDRLLAMTSATHARKIEIEPDSVEIVVFEGEGLMSYKTSKDEGSPVEMDAKLLLARFNLADFDAAKWIEGMDDPADCDYKYPNIEALGFGYGFSTVTYWCAEEGPTRYFMSDGLALDDVKVDTAEQLAAELARGATDETPTELLTFVVDKGKAQLDLRWAYPDPKFTDGVGYVYSIEAEPVRADYSPVKTPIVLQPSRDTPFAASVVDAAKIVACRDQLFGAAPESWRVRFINGSDNVPRLEWSNGDDTALTDVDCNAQAHR